MSLLGKIAGIGLNLATGGVLGGTAKTVAGLIGGKPKPPSPTSPFPTTATPDSIVTTTRGGGVMVGPYGIGGSSTTSKTYFSGRKKKKIRRMNATNPKALTRAIRRVGKFQDLAKAVGFTRAPSKMKGVHFPKRKRSSKCR
jgi:hypothetical protein